MGRGIKKDLSAAQKLQISLIVQNKARQKTILYGQDNGQDRNLSVCWLMLRGDRADYSLIVFHILAETHLLVKKNLN